MKLPKLCKIKFQTITESSTGCEFLVPLRDLLLLPLCLPWLLPRDDLFLFFLEESSTSVCTVITYPFCFKHH